MDLRNHEFLKQDLSFQEIEYDSQDKNSSGFHKTQKEKGLTLGNPPKPRKARDSNSSGYMDGQNSQGNNRDKMNQLKAASGDRKTKITEWSQPGQNNNIGINLNQLKDSKMHTSLSPMEETEEAKEARQNISQNKYRSYHMDASHIIKNPNGFNLDNGLFPPVMTTEAEDMNNENLERDPLMTDRKNPPKEEEPIDADQIEAMQAQLLKEMMEYTPPADPEPTAPVENTEGQAKNPEQAEQPNPPKEPNREETHQAEPEEPLKPVPGENQEPKHAIAQEEQQEKDKKEAGAGQEKIDINHVVVQAVEPIEADRKRERAPHTVFNFNPIQYAPEPQGKANSSNRSPVPFDLSPEPTLSRLVMQSESHAEGKVEPSGGVKTTEGDKKKASLEMNSEELLSNFPSKSKATTETKLNGQNSKEQKNPSIPKDLKSDSSKLRKHASSHDDKNYSLKEDQTVKQPSEIHSQNQQGEGQKITQFSNRFAENEIQSSSNKVAKLKLKEMGSRPKLPRKRTLMQASGENIAGQPHGDDKLRSVKKITNSSVKRQQVFHFAKEKLSHSDSGDELEDEEGHKHDSRSDSNEAVPAAGKDKKKKWSTEECMLMPDVKKLMKLSKEMSLSVKASARHQAAEEHK